jgi:hypothetical protein
LITAAAIGASCSPPESYHAGQGGLSTTGTAGTGGAQPAAGTGGPVAGSGGLGGDSGGSAGTGGLDGDTGNGTAGTGAAGTGSAGNGAAGTGAAGTGAAGTGAAGTGAAGTGAAGTGAAGAGAAGTGAAGTGAAGTGAAGTGAAGTGSATPTELALPVTVSDHFRPTGGMGDGAIVGSVSFGTDAAACAGEPAAAKAGTCYSVTYQPQPIAAGAPSTWAGFYWQYPDNNWGGQQPQLIAAGAKAVTFYAKGVAGGEKITFKAGGIINMTSVATPFSDAFNVEKAVTLTTGWTKYSLPIDSVTYGGGVLGAFCWVATATNATPIRFVLHGIVWEK